MRRGLQPATALSEPIMEMESHTSSVSSARVLETRKSVSFSSAAVFLVDPVDFDPLDMNENPSDSRDSELNHGRIAMIAALEEQLGPGPGPNDQNMISDIFRRFPNACCRDLSSS